MASSESPPSSEDVKAPPPGLESPESAGATTGEQPKEMSAESVFVDKQPIREDHVQNAVKFLSHPKVKGSPVIHRRNFLERKGLNKDEIDEAFRRVPDPSPSVTTGQGTSTDHQVKPSAAIQQNPTQTIQPVASQSSRSLSFFPNQFRWTHAIFLVGFLAASGAGTLVVFKRSIFPRFKSWIRRVVSNEDNVTSDSNSVKPSLAEEVTAAAKAASSAATDVARTSQEIVIMQSEGNRRMEELMSLYRSQIQEMKLMRNSIASLEGKNNNTVRNIHVENEYQGGFFSRGKQPMINGGTEYDSRSVRPFSPPDSAESTHVKSYTEIMARDQRGQRPAIVNKSWETIQQREGTSFASQTPFANESQDSMVQYSNTTYQQLNNQEASPGWWQQKNTRITEIENDSVSNGAGPVDQPLARRWVPPQPPPVVMPEAAVAIRQPKSIAPKDADAKLLPSHDNGSHYNGADELQRIQQISESGGQDAMNGGGSEMSSSEILEEPVGS